MSVKTLFIIMATYGVMAISYCGTTSQKTEAEKTKLSEIVWIFEKLAKE